MSEPPGAPPELTRFLREYPPFNAVDPEEVGRIAAGVEIEFHRSGTTIFSEGAEPVAHLRVVRRGAVELVHRGHVLDLVSEGEMFGHASMLSGLPTGFEARAAEDTLCYRIQAKDATQLFARPAGLRFVARSLLDWADETADQDSPGEDPLRPDGAAANPDPAQQPVSALIRSQLVSCAPETTIREAAQRMTEAGVTSVVIPLPDDTVGILTDRDLRERVLADGLGGDARVFEAMSAPAYVVGADRPGGEVLLEMLDRGVRHFPVRSAAGQIVGVVEDRDVVAVHARSSFYLRRRIARAESVADVVEAARELAPMVIAMAQASIATSNILAVRSVVVDALTRRLLELAVEAHGKPPIAFAWLALGSQARREATPSADVDSALVWFGPEDDPAIKAQLLTISQTVVDGLERCGFRADAHGASAADPLFVRSLASWQRAARSWISDPTQDKALILTSVLVDSRPVWGVHTGTPVADTFRLAPDSPQLLRMMARLALSYRPPTGFLRGLVVEDTGEHRGRLDLKHGGVIPIVDLARWAGLAASVTSASTVERLHAATAAAKLSASDALSLQDAFELITGLRLRHQITQLRAGQPPDDHVDPASLSPLMRSQLKEAFRAVRSIQRQLGAELSAGVR
ncbi:MAG TPA: putative nucleotidyltransferase substrate binding domain-containing protein [Solirubrobacteraceae bacterium]|nr:putative nucleotidyltransferase substrate binding domain-containing protein [Solirubrobacteraceae bacterium]